MNNILQFAISRPDVSFIYVGTYNPVWVAASILLAILASYAALNASRRIEHQQDAISKLSWAVISAFTLGVGIWAMHFIGMLALKLPCAVHYNPLITIISMIPGILASGVALGVVWNRGKKRLSPLIGSVLLGAGIGIMHYTGMAAMQLEGLVRYDPYLFALSIVVAVALSYLALRVKSGVLQQKIGSNVLIAAIMGSAVSGMHYTAMSAAYFFKDDTISLPQSLVSTDTLAILVILTTVFITLFTLVIATVSRNREITAELKDSEERWKFALEGAGDGVWDWNPQTDEAVFSKRWKEMIGYAEDEFSNTGAEWVKLIHPEDKSGHLSTLQEYLTSKQPLYVAEYRMRCKNGTWKWILSRGKQVSWDAAGKSVRMIGTHADITERKRAEEELKASEFRAIIDVSPVPLVLNDDHQNITFLNPAFTQTFGYNITDIPTLSDWQLKAHPDANYRQWVSNTWKTALEQAEQKHETFTPIELNVYCKDGSVKTVLASAATFSQSSRTVYLVVLYDITERKLAEIKLSNALNELKMTQTQLVQAEKMASLGTLVAGVAHEINNPVNFVHLGTHNLREDIGKQKQFLLPLLEEEHEIIDILKQQYSQFDSSLENIEEGCVRIKTIVDDLRTFSRLDEADRKAVNLIASLESTIRITQTQYQKNVQIVTDFIAQPELECWSAKLNQVFMNIIVNACHAIEKQQETNPTIPGTLTISSFENEQNERKELAIRFQDNGCGMSEEVKNKIFEPFFTTKPVGQGTGLGMSLSYGIIQEHNGRIEVESHTGQGSIITIYLPL